jgi:hypothetical protein
MAGIRYSYIVHSARHLLEGSTIATPMQDSNFEREIVTLMPAW